MAKTYRKLKVRAVNGEQKSVPFYLQQVSSAEKVERLVARIDSLESHPDKLNVSNSEYQVFGLQGQEWLANVLSGFRRKHEGMVLVVLEVEPSEIPTEKDLGESEFF